MLMKGVRMFVRWKCRRLRRDQDTLRYAELVRSVRVHGRPRQQIVQYLGSIREWYCTAPAYRQAFWDLAAERLARVPLDAATRQRVEDQLATAIPRPTGEELQQVAEQRALLEQLATGWTAHPPRLGLGPGGEPDGGAV
jgi:hypothetical protein